MERVHAQLTSGDAQSATSVRAQGGARVGTRIALGFGLVLALLVIVGFTGLWGIREATKAAQEQLRAAERTRRAVELQVEAAELKRVSQLFAHTGIEGLAGRTEELGTRIEEDLGELRARAVDPEVLDAIDLMQGHLSEYLSTFEQVAAERRLRTELARDEMPRLAAAVLEIVADRPEAEREFLRARNAARAYLEQLDSAEVVRAKEHITACAALLPDTERGPLTEFRSTFLRAVQATRGYLFLVNVVAAGQASEFAFHAERLAASSQRSGEEIANSALARSASVRRGVLAAILGALALGAFTAWRLTLGIVAPVGAVTSTFRRLARGEEVVDIPGLERGDELGELAVAADIFRARNRETEQLLVDARRLQAELESSNEELEQFVYTVSHDLKAPLVTTLGFIGMIRDLSASGEHDRAIEMLARLERPSRRMNTLISDLLEFSRVGRADLERERLDMDALLREVAETYRLQLDRAGVALLVQPDLPPIDGHRTRIKQVFENLVGNALKYGTVAGDAENPGATTIEVGARQVDDEQHFYVRDEGRGIEPESQKRIFGLFQRLDVDVEGTGIGLTIVERVMHTHGGRVWVESAPGEGATFWLAFPALASTPQAVGA